MSTRATAARAATREAMAREVFDLAVVGGGINGAAIARDAALRGYRVVLLEQQDFGAGTSSRSSRLIHGGLRYLEHGEVGLVFESVSERARLARLARHLVRPLGFAVPVYRWNQRSLLEITVGMWLYDGLALFRNYRTHRRYRRREIMDAFPALRREGLTGGVHYYDYRTDDARMVLENVLGAVQAGAEALSRARVVGIVWDAGRARGLEVEDRLAGETFRVRARAVVCAAGPWTDAVLGLAGETRRWLSPTKGVHIVVPRERVPIDEALVLQHPRDGRVHFALPYHERTVLGTTDTFFSGDPADVHTTADDVAYLFESAGYYFPEANLRPEHVLSSWAGVRPLLREPDADDPGAVSREHHIEVRPDGVTVIAGGKLTTYRLMAAECVEAVVPEIETAGGPAPLPPPGTDRLPLPGARGLDSDEALEALARELGEEAGDPATGEHLALTYGVRARGVLEVAAQIAGGLERLTPELPHLRGEVAHAAREERALDLVDTLVRRLQVFYRAEDQGLSLAAEVARLMGDELGWDAATRDAQAADYLRVVERSRAWRKDWREEAPSPAVS